MQSQESKFGRYPKPLKALASFINTLAPNLEKHLEQAGIDKSPREFIIGDLISVFYVFLILLVMAFMVSWIFDIIAYFAIAVIVVLCISGVIFFRGMLSPKYLAQKRIKSIENNLIPVLRSMHVQLDAGLPLFDVMVSISQSDYGEISDVFKEAVQRISSGVPQIAVLEDISRKTPSLFFRRAIWQITNSLSSGGEISKVIAEVTEFLSQERFYEIQVYGSKLKALVMFYMLVVIIIPSLGISFLVIVLSLVSAEPFVSKFAFVAVEVLIFLIQIMFFGVIKSSRPSLIRE